MEKNTKKIILFLLVVLLTIAIGIASVYFIISLSTDGLDKSLILPVILFVGFAALLSMLFIIHKQSGMVKKAADFPNDGRREREAKVTIEVSSGSISFIQSSRTATNVKPTTVKNKSHTVVIN